MAEAKRDYYPSILALRQVRAQVRLGVGADERATPQDVLGDIRFYLPTLPGAARDDEGDYLSYHGLGERVYEVCTKKAYRLIQFLTHEIYRVLRAELPQEVRLCLRLHKVRILLPYVEVGASYTFTDL